MKKWTFVKNAVTAWSQFVANEQEVIDLFQGLQQDVAARRSQRTEILQRREASKEKAPGQRKSQRIQARKLRGQRQ